MTVLDAVVDGMSAGERREGQRDLAQAVVDAITDGHHLVAEAPLVPAMRARVHGRESRHVR